MFTYFLPPQRGGKLKVYGLSGGVWGWGTPEGNVDKQFFSSASAQRICRWGSHSRSAASWPDGAPPVSRLHPPGGTDKRGLVKQKSTGGTLISVLHLTHNHRFVAAILYLDHTVMNRGVLLLPQHHQGNDDDSCYDNPSDHESDYGTLIGPHIVSEKHLPLKNKTIQYMHVAHTAGGAG